jgi:hypothetical protein
MGLIVSIKIGGGSNLHNLDMFILTLVFVSIIAISQTQNKIQSININYMHWLSVVIVILMVLPGWFTFRSHTSTPIINSEIENKALEIIKHEVNMANRNGEVLFIDQRQLLTFGYIKNIPLVPDYEKKYMMDQALVNNIEYFDHFYTDLANKRFSLIISDYQKDNIQLQIEAFSEENNAYVMWVSRPILKYYEPIVTIKPLGIELLIPKP